MKRAGAVLAFLTVCVVLLIAGMIYYYRDSVGSGLKPTSDPGFTWGVATPDSQGLDTAKLDSMWATLQSKSTTAFLVVRNDKIVYEKYVSMNRNQKHYTASMVKGLAGGMSLMVAMNDGLISPDNLVRQYVPQWAADDIKSAITVRELATHTSGLDDAEEGGLPHEQLTGWKGDFWKRLPVPNDPFTLSRDAAPVLFPPGTVASYSNPGFAMLGYAVTAALKGAADQDIRSLLQNRIMSPIGVPSGEWSCGYDETFTVDGFPLVPIWGGGQYSPDAVARVGRLLLRRGDWDGNQLLSPAVVQEATTHPIPGLPGYGLFGWWGNVDNDGDRVSPSLPKDAFFAKGAGHQIVLVITSLNLIMVRNGESLDNGDFDLAIETNLFAPLMAAVIQAAVTTNAATSVTEAGGTVNGAVDPNGQETTAWFEWGTDPGLSTFSSTAGQSVGSGTTVQAVSAALSGLSPATAYYFRAAASNAGGTAKGSILTFSTTAPLQAPVVTTNAATSVTETGGTVNGAVNPNGQETTAWFEWGTDPGLSTFSSTAGQSVGSGTTSQAVNAALSGLSPGTAYYFRAVASNAGGTAKGSILTFSTTAPLQAPAVTTDAATAVTGAGATVNGTVNPNGQETTARFEWGTDPVLSTFSSTSEQDLGSGTTSQAVNAALSGLSPGTYYFRAVASNAGGTAKGSILTFSTTAPLQAPAVTTDAATAVTGAGATVNGSVNPNGQETTAWFEWGTDPALGAFSSTAGQSVGSGTTVQAVNAALSGLSPGT
jgi:CubicO group peptidase (beta-lactamase class C family)